MAGNMSTMKLRRMKQDGEPICMITAYDYPSARLAEAAGVDLILVGDSLGNVVLGYESTIPVTLDVMIHHTKAVTRGAPSAFVVTDMPFLTYHGSTDITLSNGARIMQEGLANAVKLEGGKEIVHSVEALVKAGIPVMGHLGLTPQSVHQLGGYRVQGKQKEQINRLVEDAKRLEQAGVFALVLELVTEEVAERLTKELSMPTIGIGAGRGCDGQVLVFHDLLQYAPEPEEKKFVKTYADIGRQIQGAISDYVKDVKTRNFPEEKHGFKLAPDMITVVYGNNNET